MRGTRQWDYHVCPSGIIASLQDGKHKPLHDENGKFAVGHPKVGGVKKGYRSVRHYRNKLMEQLAPFIESMGEIIEAIDDPGDKVLAVSRIIKYAMPSLSSIDFKENERVSQRSRR